MSSTTAPRGVPRPTKPAGKPHAYQRAGQTIGLWIFVFLLLSVASFLHQQIDFVASLNNAIPVPDVLTVSRTFDNLWASGEFDSSANQFIGLAFLYSWTWIFHPSLCFLVNAGLMAWAGKIYVDEFIAKRGVPAWSIIGIFGNPFLALAMVGPNKEIPLLLLTLLFFKAIANRGRGWLPASVAICLAIMAFREGYGAFLLASIGMLLALQFKARHYALLATFVCASVAALFGILEKLVPIFGRNTEVLEVIGADNIAVGALAGALNLDPLSPIGGLLLFSLRLTYNLFSLAFFPVFQTTEGISWLGLSFWLNGLVTLVCIPACVAALFDKQTSRTQGALAAAFVIGTLCMISLSLFVQPRYMMPMLPLAIAVFASSPARTRLRCLQAGLLLSATIVFGYRLLDRAPLPVEPDSFPTPSYIIE